MHIARPIGTKSVLRSWPPSFFIYQIADTDLEIEGIHLFTCANRSHFLVVGPKSLKTFISCFFYRMPLR